MWTELAEGTLDAAMGSYAAAQSVLQGDRGVVFAMHSQEGRRDPECQDSA
jgi:hypothetical protein